MKFKEKFDYNILKLNTNETIFANHVEINVVIIIMNDKKKFSIKKSKLHIFEKKSTIILNNIMMSRC